VSPIVRQPPLPWQPFCAPLVEGRRQLPSMNLIRPPSTELLHFLIEYVTWPCDLHLWPSDIGVMSRYETCFQPLCQFWTLVCRLCGKKLIQPFHTVMFIRSALYEGLSHYKMDSEPRGRCLIINMMTFSKGEPQFPLNPRPGADKDVGEFSVFMFFCSSTISRTRT